MPIRRSGSNAAIANGRSVSFSQSSPRLSNRNQLDPSPQELPVKDTDRSIDITSAECKLFYSYVYIHNKFTYNIIIICTN